MPLEDADFIAELNPLWPLGTDGVNTSDDHHRNTKKATQQSFPNINKEVTSNSDDLNLLSGGAANGSGLNPVGTVLAGMWSSAPDGFLACDGSAINPIYTELIALVGSNTPNLRGDFLRGWSTSTGQDPDAPRAAGDFQDDAFQSHTHPVNGLGRVDPVKDTEGGGGDPRVEAFNTDTAAATGRTAAETRPKNVAVFYVIKW